MQSEKSEKIGLDLTIAVLFLSSGSSGKPLPNGQWGMGSGEWGVGSGQWGVGNRE